MRNFYLGLGVALLFGGAGLAHAAGGGSALVSAGVAGSTGGAAAPVPSTINSTATLPPAPPANITTPPFAQGVPPTPAPAFPGLPSPGVSAATPGSTGLPNQTTNDLRQTQNASGPVDVTQVQIALANGGFYRGPIDGTLSGTTRASVRAFQGANALPTTGQLDPQTIAALGVNSFAPTVQTASGLAGAASPTANGNAVTTMPTSGGSAANSSLNAAGGVTANPIPTPVAGTPGIPTPGVTGGTTNTQRSTEPFPLSMPAPSSPYVGTPIFIQP